MVLQCTAIVRTAEGPFTSDALAVFSGTAQESVALCGCPALTKPSDDRMHTSQCTERRPMSTTMTLRLEDDVKARTDATQLSKSFLAAEAIRDFVENIEWQIREIKAAIKEANAGDFAGDDEVAALAKKWKLNAR